MNPISPDPNPTTPFVPLTVVGVSVLKALAATTPELPRVRLDSGEPPASAGGLSGGSTAPEHRYQIEGEIARGGMGAVLRGRDEDLGREIALKVMLETHRGKTELLQRFVEEAQIAGQLQHPGITPVYELGQFPDRRPYFTMKLVRGQTLAALLASPGRESGGASAEQPHPHPPADAGGSPSRTRFLKIFEQICQTLAYAHARRVLHRDLKPANIMVGAYGEVQVMDWGLAKVLGTPASPGRESGGASASQPRSHPLAHAGGSPAEDSVRTKSATPETEAGSVLGTPSYMAPEQARGEIDQLDERADVFGLGAILCEILTGKPPYVGASGVAIYQKAAAGDLADAFARLDQSGADADLIALAKRALSANPDGRPRDAGALTAELTAYLNGVEQRLKNAELAAAQAKTKAEEETKRRQLTFKLAAAILVTLLAGLAGSLWFLNRSLAAEKLAKANEDQAVKRLGQIEKGNALLAGLFEALDVNELAAGGERLEQRLGRRLQAAAAALRDEAIGDPLTVAALQHTLGNSFLVLGMPEPALELAEAAARTRARLLGPTHPATLRSRNNLARAHQDMGDYGRALRLLEELGATYRTTLGPDHPDTLVCQDNRATCLQMLGRHAEALPLHEEASRLKKARLGAAHADTIAGQNNLATCLHQLGRPEQAAPLLEEALAAARLGFGADHPAVFQLMGNLAHSLQKTGKAEAALALREEAHRGLRAKLGTEHPLTLKALANRAGGLMAAGRTPEALPLYDDVLLGLKARLGADHPDTLRHVAEAAMALAELGEPERAAALLTETEAALRQRLGAGHPLALEGRDALAMAYLQAGQPQEALALSEEALRGLLPKLGADSPTVLAVQNNVAAALLALERPAQALPLCEATLRGRREKLGADHPLTAASLVNLGRAKLALGQVAAAAAHFEAAWRVFHGTLGPGHPHAQATLGWRAAALREAGRTAEAAPLLEQAARWHDEGQFRRPGAESAVANWVECLEKLGRFAPAESWRRKWAAAVKERAGGESSAYADELLELGINLLEQGKAAEAETEFRACLAIRRRQEPNAWTTANAEALVGAALLHQKKTAAALSHLEAGHAGLKRLERTPEALDPETAFAESCFTAAERLAQAYEALGKPTEARRLRAELEARRPPPKPPAR